jgi:hypothetical protein
MRPQLIKDKPGQQFTDNLAWLAILKNQVVSNI